MENTNKFVVALNEKYEINDLLSAIGHVTAALSVECSNRDIDLGILEYETADGVILPISDYNFMVLKGRRNHVRKFYDDLKEEKLPCVCYTDTMLAGGTNIQRSATKERSYEDLDILAVGTFGPTETINQLSKRLSLWR